MLTALVRQSSSILRSRSRGLRSGTVVCIWRSSKVGSVNRDVGAEADSSKIMDDTSILTMRQTPRTRSRTRSLREEFNLSFERLITLLEHEDLKEKRLTKEISQETQIGAGETRIPTQAKMNNKSKIHCNSRHHQLPYCRFFRKTKKQVFFFFTISKNGWSDQGELLFNLFKMGKTLDRVVRYAWSFWLFLFS